MAQSRNAAPRRIAVIIGSLRAGSYTRKIVQAAIARAPETLDCRIIEIGDLPLYNEDLDRENPPAPWARFRKEIAGRDGVLFATPEYNRSMPACLKNALDVGSRPQGKNLWDGMPAAIISVTPYKLGAFGANHALRQALVFTNLPVMQQPEAYIGNAADLLDKDGNLVSDDTAKFLTKFMAAFDAWVATIQGGKPGDDFQHFLENERSKAAEAYARGDAAPLDKLIAAGGEASFFSPMGDIVQGPGKVKARYDADAKAFGKDGSSKLDIVQSATSGTLAFWTGTQTADVILDGKRKHMTLRITEIFRRTGGVWQLVHRHADPAKEAG
jgi:NAD(P)H-dependent FMN reductase/ketosteroid isomerase-like protein